MGNILIALPAGTKDSPSPLTFQLAVLTLLGKVPCLAMGRGVQALFFFLWVPLLRGSSPEGFSVAGGLYNVKSSKILPKDDTS